MPLWHSIIMLTRTYWSSAHWESNYQTAIYTERGCITISILRCQITHRDSNALWQSWLPATQLSEDVFTGERKSDLSKWSISVFFTFSHLLPQLPSVAQFRCASHFAIYISLEEFHCPYLHGATIDEKASVLRQLTFTRRCSWHDHGVGLHTKPTHKQMLLML